MKKTCLLLGLLCLLACQNRQSNSSDESQNYSKVDVEKLTQMLKSQAEVQLIDVRTAKEFEQGHIEGAVNIDFRKNNFQENIAQLKKEQPVVVYCRTGRRSNNSLEAFKKMDFKEVYDLSGGYKAWSVKKE
ncbi:MAG: rhodanese-like domain-containing protein [Bacteroidota bacterium]